MLSMVIQIRLHIGLTCQHHQRGNNMEQRKRKKLSERQRETTYNKTNGHCAYGDYELEYKDTQADHVVPFIMWPSMQPFLPSKQRNGN